MALNPGGDLAPHETFDKGWRYFQLSQLGVCYWLLAGRGQGRCCTPFYAQNTPPPHDKELASPNVNNAEVKKPCPNISSSFFCSGSTLAHECTFLHSCNDSVYFAFFLLILYFKHLNIATLFSVF